MGRTSDANVRLMDAALELMWAESYGAVTIDDICRRADVRKGSFYYFFKSKAELAVAALEKLWAENWRPRLDTFFSPSVDPVARIENYLTSMYEVQKERCAKYGKVLGCPVCSLGSEISTQEVDVCAKVREIVARKRRYYESAIREALAQGAIEPCDPAERTLAISCLIEGAMSQARIMNDPEVLRSLPRSARDILRVKAVPVAAR
jgi:TetR/AcrR family transcriptional repressor of nem operon